MAMKGYSAFPKAPGFLEPHHQILSVISGHSLVVVWPLCWEAVVLFYSPSRLGIFLWWFPHIRRLDILVRVVFRDYSTRLCFFSRWEISPGVGDPPLSLEQKLKNFCVLFVQDIRLILLDAAGNINIYNISTFQFFISKYLFNIFWHWIACRVSTILI